MLSTSAVCELCDLPRPTLQHWLEDGLTSPDHLGGGGRDNGHLFGTPKAVGLVVASRLRASDFGLAPAGIRRVVEAFGAVDEGWLEAQFRKRKTHFAGIAHGLPVLIGKPLYDAADVKAAYDAVKNLEK